MPGRRSRDSENAAVASCTRPFAVLLPATQHPTSSYIPCLRMAKAAAHEDSEEEEMTTGRGRAAEKEVSDVEEDNEQDGDEDEEVFEIEAILMDKKNVVKKV